MTAKLQDCRTARPQDRKTVTVDFMTKKYKLQQIRIRDFPNQKY